MQHPSEVLLSTLTTLNASRPRVHAYICRRAPPSAPRAKNNTSHPAWLLSNDAMARLGQALITLRCFACLPVNTTRMLAVVLSVCALLWCSVLTYASQTEGKQSSCCPTSYVAAKSNQQEGGGYILSEPSCFSAFS